ncbi:glycosyltransferase family 25 protein [Snodgrassella sp. CFCC 13594]|uniref:glycosyltransferase family 25 protein n=1 Tax=Snodgrassella sp. CFCC 13594 TaxID=1775559 RepID=UPI0008369952|nr:glycosyltransferase family 25 protein [Snodgrassella sp. CFCC 13594]
MISALIINLDRSKERLAFQCQQLAALGVNMQRLPAVNADDLSVHDYEALANGWERKMRPAEVACFLSHQAAWQKVADDGHPYLILEDDALLSRQLPQLLQALSENIWQADYVTLEARNRKKLLGKQSFDLIDGNRLYRLYQDRSGAAAYVLYPQGARKLLIKTAQEEAALADAFLCRAYELNAYQIYPAAAIQLDQCMAYGLRQTNFFASTITPANHTKLNAPNVRSHLCFKYRRIAAQCRMGWRQLTVLGRAHRVWVPVHVGDFAHTVDQAD